MSELIEWDDSLSVGIDIDEQHKVLVRLLNDLDRAIKPASAPGSPGSGPDR